MKTQLNTWRRHLISPSLAGLGSLMLATVMPVLGAELKPDASPAKINATGVVRGDLPVVASVAGPQRFNLDFQGGTPQMFVDAVAEFAGHPINVIIAEEDNDVRIPPMRLRRVTVDSVFEAVSVAGQTIRRGTNPGGGGAGNGSHTSGSVTFQYLKAGEDRESPVWVFHCQRGTTTEPLPPTRVVRYFQLAPYLGAEQGLKVEDITTAIRTGYELLGEKSSPELKFHKETRLLIAVGEPNQLNLIDEVLKSLSPEPTIDPVTGTPTTSRRAIDPTTGQLKRF